MTDYSPDPLSTLGLSSLLYGLLERGNSSKGDGAEESFN